MKHMFPAAALIGGLFIAAGAGAALMLVSALAVWVLLRDLRFLFGRLPGQPQVGVLADPGVHGDAGGDGGVDAAGRAELCDRHH